MSIGIFIQARTGSIRLPGKIFKKIGGRPALQIMVDNIKNTKYSDCIYILTSNKKRDDKVEDFAVKEKVYCFRGDEDDVLGRFFHTADKYNVDDIVRLTGDCPFLSMNVLEENINGFYKNDRPDYYYVKNYPLGIGAVEVMNFGAIKRAYYESHDSYHREHVMTYLEDNPQKFRLVIKEAHVRYRRPDIRLTLDEQKDLDLLRIVYGRLNGKIDIDGVIRLFDEEPQLLNINKTVKQRN